MEITGCLHSQESAFQSWPPVLTTVVLVLLEEEIAFLGWHVLITRWWWPWPHKRMVNLSKLGLLPFLQLDQNFPPGNCLPLSLAFAISMHFIHCPERWQNELVYGSLLSPVWHQVNHRPTRLEKRILTLVVMQTFSQTSLLSSVKVFARLQKACSLHLDTSSNREFGMWRLTHTQLEHGFWLCTSSLDYCKSCLLRMLPEADILLHYLTSSQRILTFSLSVQMSLVLSLEFTNS